MKYFISFFMTTHIGGSTIFGNTVIDCNKEIKSYDQILELQNKIEELAREDDDDVNSVVIINYKMM